MLNDENMSGITSLDLPVLPDGWTYRELGDLLQDSGLAYGIVQPGQEDPTGVPILRVKNIRCGRVIADEVLRVNEDVEAGFQRTRLKGGEVLLTLVGTVGEVAIAPSFVKGWNVARAIAVIRVLDAVENSWIQLCLESGIAQQFMHIRQTTTVQATLNLRDVRHLPIVLPPKKARDEIIGIIGSLDDKIVANVAGIRLASELSAATFERFFENPEDLSTIRLGSLADVIDCLHSKKPESVENGRRYLVLADIREDSRLDPTPNFSISERDYAKWTRRFEAREGDCVITNVGRVGAVGQVPRAVTAAIGRNMTGIRGRDDCPPAFLVEALRSSTVRNEIEMKADQGTIMAALNVRAIPDLLIPAGTTQARRDFQEKVGPLHRLQDQLLAENAHLGGVRDTLLPRLMSGEIRVRDAEKVVEDVT